MSVQSPTAVNGAVSGAAANLAGFASLYPPYVL